jgi:hypothetical protein
VALTRRPQQPVSPGTAARQFLYLDTSLLAELLSGIDRGSIGPERRTTEETRVRTVGGDASVKIPGTPIGVGGHGERTATTAAQTDVDVEQTPEGRFSRLVAGLEKNVASVRLEAPDGRALDAMRPGDAVELNGPLTITCTSKLAAGIASLQLGSSDTSEAIDWVRRHVVAKLFIAAYDVLNAFPLVDVDPTVTATTTGDRTVHFEGRLDAKSLRTRIDGDVLYAKLLAKLDSPLDDGPTRMSVVGIYR